MSMPIPRFRGKTFEKDGGWTFEFMISLLGDDDGVVYACELIFKTKDEALTNLKLTIQDAIKQLKDKAPEMGIDAETYIDMKTNSTRRWDRKDEQ